jgi:tetratricopeptide (TPR) repeat protein
MGRLAEALFEAQRVVELDPLSARYNAALGYVYDVAGQHDAAIPHYRRAMDLDPSMYLPHFTLALAYGHMGRFEEATAAAQRACELSGRSARMLGVLAWAHGRAGRQSEARALVEELTARRRTTYVPPAAMVFAYRGLEEVDQVLDWLEKAVEERDLNIIYTLKFEQAYALHDHPRYHALLRKMNLEDRAVPGQAISPGEDI